VVRGFFLFEPIPATLQKRLDYKTKIGEIPAKAFYRKIIAKLHHKKFNLLQ